jgi:Plasmid pRiA4b ORF-3-like protein
VKSSKVIRFPAKKSLRVKRRKIDVNRIEPSELVYQLKIEVAYIKEPVWRRVLVDGLIGLPDLNRVIQIAMGWNDAHKHQFIFGHKAFGHPIYPDLNSMAEDWYCLATSLVCDDKFSYLYGPFGGWRLNVTVEKTLSRQECHSTPYLMDGAGAMPAESIKNLGRNQYLCTVMSDYDHPHYKNIKEWLSKNCGLFSAQAVNAAMLREFGEPLVMVNPSAE